MSAAEAIAVLSPIPEELIPPTFVESSEALFTTTIVETRTETTTTEPVRNPSPLQNLPPTPAPAPPTASHSTTVTTHTTQIHSKTLPSTSSARANPAAALSRSATENGHVGRRRSASTQTPPRRPAARTPPPPQQAHSSHSAARSLFASPHTPVRTPSSTHRPLTAPPRPSAHSLAMAAPGDRDSRKYEPLTMPDPEAAWKTGREMCANGACGMRLLERFVRRGKRRYCSRRCELLDFRCDASNCGCALGSNEDRSVVKYGPFFYHRCCACAGCRQELGPNVAHVKNVKGAYYHVTCADLRTAKAKRMGKAYPIVPPPYQPPESSVELRRRSEGGGPGNTCGEWETQGQLQEGGGSGPAHRPAWFNAYHRKEVINYPLGPVPYAPKERAF